MSLYATEFRALRSGISLGEQNEGRGGADGEFMRLRHLCICHGEEGKRVDGGGWLGYLLSLGLILLLIKMAAACMGISRLFCMLASKVACTL